MFVEFLRNWPRAGLLITESGVLISDLQLWSLRNYNILPRDVGTELDSGPARDTQKGRAWMNLVRPCLCLAHIVFFSAPSAPFVFALLLASMLGHKARYGSNGADSMFLVMLGTLAAGELSQTGCATRDLAAFLSGYLCIVYLTASLAKLHGTSWRSGTALLRIISTKTFGRRWLAAFYQEHTWLSPASCWLVIFGELLFAFAAWMPPRICLGLIVAAICFHLVNAMVMGLNTFLFAFAAFYPALYAHSVAVWATGGIEKQILLPMISRS